MKKTADKKLIALFTNNDDDVYCFRKELVEAITDNGYKMLISCPYGEKFELMKDIDFVYDDPFIDRRGTNIINDSKLFLHYFNLLRKHRPAVVLTYTAKPNVYCGLAAQLLGIPVISNVTGFGSVINHSGFVQNLVMLLFKTVFRRSACIMFQNSTNMKLAEEKGMVRGERVLIPGSGVNTDRFPAQPYPDGGDGKTGENVVFNYVGRVLKDKGVDDYIEAAKRIKKNYPCTQFNMLGFIEPTEIHYEKELAELEKDGILKFHGSQKDTKPFIRASHAIIHPSTYGEGMSNVLLESGSSARPIISTDNPGCMETFIDGETGFIYRGGDVDALCSCIERFLALPNEQRKLMGDKGREYIKNNFSRNIVIKEYLEKINKLA